MCRRSNISVALLASPMLRALQTATPLCVALGVDLQVDPSLCDGEIVLCILYDVLYIATMKSSWHETHLHELCGRCAVGGHFVAASGDGRADAPSATEIASLFAESEVAVDVTRLPKEGPWDGGVGFESISEARLRATQVAEALSDMALADEMDVIVLVTHDAFLKLLLTALLLPSTSDPAAGWGLNCEILNTATSALELDPFGAAGSAQLLWLNRIDHFLLSARM